MTSEAELIRKAREAQNALTESRDQVAGRRQRWAEEAPELAKELSDILQRMKAVAVEYRPTSKQLLVSFGAGYHYPETELLEDGAALVIAPDLLSGLLGVAHIGFQPFKLADETPLRAAPIKEWIEPSEIKSRIFDLIASFLDASVSQSPTNKPRRPKADDPEAKTIGFRRQGDE